MSAVVITSAEAFSAIFSSESDSLLLCYEGAADQVTKESLLEFERRLIAEIEKHKAKVSFYVWDCAAASFSAAKQQLSKVPGELLLVVVYKKEIADMVRGHSLEAIIDNDVPRVCKRLASFQSGAKIGAVDGGSGGGTLRVDVAKMVGMGKKLMAEGQSMYAEKFFAKAITTLDTVKQEMDGLVSEGEKEDYVGSVAMCLSWAAIAQLVQGGSPRECPYLKRLAEPQFIPFTTEPMSEASRAVTIQQLMLAAPKTWTGETCSRTKLSALLEKNPQDHDSRSMLVITLFLSGDLERCLTEALKLQVLGVDFGRVAVKKVSAFLGEDHTLVQQLGTSKASQS